MTLDRPGTRSSFGVPLFREFNPFLATPNPFGRGHLFANQVKRAAVAAGLEWFQEHAPKPESVERGLGAWILRQLNSEKCLKEFTIVWTEWVDARGKQGLRHRLNQSIDNKLVEAEFHLSQFTQEDCESFAKDILISEAERVQMKLLTMIGAFGENVSQVGRTGVDLRLWAGPAASAMFRLCFDRWRREISCGKKALTKALKKADEAMEGEQFTVPARPLRRTG